MVIGTFSRKKLRDMEFLQIFNNFNWLDWVIIAVVLIFFFDGWQTGFLALASGFAAYLLAFWTAFQFHAAVGGFVISRLGIQEKWKDAVGYILIIFMVQIVVSQILILLLNRTLKRFIPYRLDTLFGSLFAVANSLISITLILLL